MIEGQVGDDDVPRIVLSVAGRTWQVIVDTGFNGWLQLPSALREVLDADYVGRVVSLLADNQSVEEDVYMVDFPFDGQTVHATVTFVEGAEILVGTRLLQHHRLLIDFPARVLRLERLI